MSAIPKSEIRALLRHMSSDGEGDSIKLRRDNTIFGREKGDIILTDKEISSTHFQIQCIQNDYHIFDMNSTNGTFVNGERIVRAKLKNGDMIMAGKTTFKFSLEAESQTKNISTIFSSSFQGRSSETRSKMVDTIIENELSEPVRWGIQIQVNYGNGESEVLELEQTQVYIGRSSSFGKFDKDPELSRKHLMIKVNSTGEVFIEDKGSTNGSFINGVKLQGIHRVTPKDNVGIGLCSLSISSRQR